MSLPAPYKIGNRTYRLNPPQVKPRKIDDEALLKDVQEHPYDYLYERARRFGCTDMGIHKALKRLGITRKKTKEYTPSQTSSSS